MLLVITRLAARPDAMAVVSSLTGLACSDVTLRLTGALPRVLLVSADSVRMQSLAGELTTAGFGALVCDPNDAPGDGQRIVPRTLELSPGGLLAIERSQATHDCPMTAIGLFQRGIRAVRETPDEERQRQPRPRVGLGGGLTSSAAPSPRFESREAFVVIHRVDGQRDIILYERRLDFRFLGAALQPSTLQNLMLTLRRLRALAPLVPFDERTARRPFVDHRASLADDPVDLALHLVKLVQVRTVSPYRS
jgi:hypothetical protein